MSPLTRMAALAAALRGPRGTAALLCLMIALAAYLRLLGVAEHPLLGAELVSHQAAQEPLLRLLTPPPPQGLFMIPLTYMLLNLGMQLDPTLLGLRLPSLLFGIAGLPLLYLVGRRLLGRSTALVACALLVFSPVHVFHSQLAKFYALMMVLSLGCLLALLRILRRPDHLGVAGLAALGLLSLWNQYFSALALLGTFLYAGLVLLRRRRRGEGVRPALFALAMAAGLVVVGYLPYLPSFLEVVVFNEEGGFGRAVTPRLFADARLVGELFALYGPGPGRGWWLYAFLLATGLAACAARREQAGWLLLTHMVLPMGVFIMLGSGFSFDGEYLMFALPVYLLLVARGIVALARLAGRVPRVGRALAPLVPVLLLGLCAQLSLPALWGYLKVHELRTYRSMAHLQLAELALQRQDDGELLFHLPFAGRFLHAPLVHGADSKQDPALSWFETVDRAAGLARSAMPEEVPTEKLAGWRLGPGERQTFEQQVRVRQVIPSFCRWAASRQQAAAGSAQEWLRRLGEGGPRGGLEAGQHLSRAIAALAGGRWDEAARQATRGAALRPGRPELQVVRGLGLARAGQAQKGGEALHRGLALMDAMYAYAPQKVDGMSNNYRIRTTPFENSRQGYGYRKGYGHRKRHGAKAVP